MQADKIKQWRIVKIWEREKVPLFRVQLDYKALSRDNSYLC